MDIQDIKAKYGVQQADASGVGELENLYKKANQFFIAAQRNKPKSATNKQATIRQLKGYYNELMRGWMNASRLVDAVHTLYFSIDKFINELDADK